jgi:molybdenum cofactor biosynthesis enzyme MoaA
MDCTDSTSRSLRAGDTTEALYHVTVLSNFARAYDKYARVYDKAGIVESTFPDRFFLLARHELGIGIAKASALLRKTGLAGDRLIVVQTHADARDLHPNVRTGRGRFVERSFVHVNAVHFVDDADRLTDVRIEEATALSLRLHAPARAAYEHIVPRSVSLLPIARACQARCPFCFSKASVSAEMESKPVDWHRVGQVLEEARVRGATRAVITGGGEPALLRDGDLDRLIREAAAVFPKVVLITNGFKWGHMTREVRAKALDGLERAGLSVLAVSRHHFDPARNAALMSLDTGSEALAQSWSMPSGTRQLKLRWICVLQRGGIEDRTSLERYLDWTVDLGVEEVCFKELYVAASIESEYYDRAANDWSAKNQVPLQLVLDLADDAGWNLKERLPWGAPVFEGRWRNRPVRIAAYTEPSVLWELTHRICRSWNLMADGRCLASLEDPRSEVLAHELRKLQTIS